MIHDYPILQRFLPDDIQDMTPVTPEYFVVHSTANPGATDEDHVRWLSGARRPGWAGYYIDHDSISQVVPEGRLMPAEGPTYNAKALSLEMCEPSQKLPWAEQLRRFYETWQRAVWLAAWTCHRYGWGVDRIRNHAQISAELPNETDHQDPLAFFARYGNDWGDFTTDVGSLLEEMNGALPKPEPWQEQYITDLMNAGLLSQRRHPMQPILWWEQATQNLKLLERIKVLEARLTQPGAGK